MMLKSAAHWLEVARRKVVVRRRQTDLFRWSRPAGWSMEWSDRAAIAGSLIEPGDCVFDLGCADMLLEKFLPVGCTYIPSDCVSRDDRTVVCDLNIEFPELPLQVNCVTVLGVLEYLNKPKDFISWLSSNNCSVILSYCPTDSRKGLDRSAQGWVNGLSSRDILDLFAAEEMKNLFDKWISENQRLFKFAPRPGNQG